MWQVAKPVVEEYVRTHVGPQAFARDLAQTAKILSRFGPRLPRLVEDALIAQAHPKPEQTPARRVGPLGYGLAGGGLVALGVVIGAAL